MPRPRAGHFDREFGARLKQIRNMRNMTQKDISEIVDKTWQQVFKYETGTNRVPLAVAAELRRTLGISIDELIDEIHGESKDGDAIRKQMTLLNAHHLISMLIDHGKNVLPMLQKMAYPDKRKDAA